MHRYAVDSGSDGATPIKMFLLTINKEIIREEELPASLVLANTDTGQSVVDEDLLTDLLCACLHVSAYTAFVFYNNTCTCN